MERTIKKSELLSKLGNICRVSNLNSPRSWRPVANQYDLIHTYGRAFQSYNTLIAVKLGGTLYLSDYHDYSNTTSKYATEWTGYNTRERREGLKDGRFVLIIDDEE